MKISSALLLFLFTLGPVLLQAQTKRAYGIRLEEGSNRKVAEVYAGSPGEKAGVKAGDIVLMIGTDNTNGLDNTAIAAKLISHEETTISIERAGVLKMMAIKKISFCPR